MSLNRAPDGPFEVQQVALALQEYIEAAHEERTARNAFEGYSWDHFGRRLIDARDSAANTLAEKLNAYVDARVRAALDGVQWRRNP